MCDFVGAFKSGKNYYLAAKIFFYKNHNFDSTNNKNFGKLEVEAITINKDKSKTIDTNLFINDY